MNLWEELDACKFEDNEYLVDHLIEVVKDEEINTFEELEKYQEDYFKESGMTKEDWINVNDALPDVDVKCLCATSNGKIMVSSMYIPKDCYGKILGDKKWHGSSSTASSITHWMYVVLP